MPPPPPYRPRIGVTTSLSGDEQRLDLAYVRAIERAGGLPLPVPFLETGEAAEAFAALLDGLVVTGGPAIAEGLVGELPADLAPTDSRRLASDRRLLGLFLEASRPALGICYGMQLASALRGGTIYADVEAQRPGALVHSAGRGGEAHPVGVREGTHLHRILGREALVVNTRHVQALATLGRGLEASAVAPDGTVEAIETPDGAFVGVQFHPEAMDPPLDALFGDLVARCMAGRTA